MKKLPELVKENTKGIVITHASNLTGNITDLERIREVTESREFAFGGRRVADGGNFTGGCTETGNRYLLLYRA